MLLVGRLLLSRERLGTYQKKPKYNEVNPLTLKQLFKTLTWAYAKNAAVNKSVPTAHTVSSNGADVGQIDF